MDTKKIIRRTAAVFIVCVLVMAFFSTTIYNYRLPYVSVEYVQAGAITTSLYGEGQAELLMEYPLYAEFAGTITVHAREGKTYVKGEVLFSVTPDTAAISAALAAQAQALALLESRLAQNAYDLTFNKAKLAAPAENSATEALNLQPYDSQIAGIEMNLASQRKTLSDMQLLYAMGTVTLSDVTAAENTVTSSEMQLSDAQAARQAAIDTHEKTAVQSAEAAAKQRAETIAALNRTISDLEFQRTEMELSRIETMEKIVVLEKMPLTAMDVPAPSDCVVRNIMVETGETVGMNQKLLRIGHINQEYEAELLFTSDLPAFTEDTDILLSVPSALQNGIHCTILRVTHNKNDMTVRVRFTASGLVGGERIETRYEHISPKHTAILPNSALMGTTGDYKVFAVEMKPGVFGNEYYLRERFVERYDYNDSVSAVSLYMDLDTTPYVVSSDRLIRDGDRVRLADGLSFTGSR